MKKYSILKYQQGKMTKASRELSLTMLTKRTEATSDTTALGLITQPRGKSLVRRNHSLDSSETLTPALHWLVLSGLLLIKDIKMKFPLHLHQSLWDSLGPVWLPGRYYQFFYPSGLHNPFPHLAGRKFPVSSKLISMWPATLKCVVSSTIGSYIGWYI